MFLANLIKKITRRESAAERNAEGAQIDRLVRQNAKPNPTLAKTSKPREETRCYTKGELMNRWLRRGERRPIEGDLAGGLLAETTMTESALSDIRASRERLDSLHGPVLDLAPRLRDLCWAIDADLAASRDAEPEPSSAA